MEKRIGRLTVTFALMKSELNSSQSQIKRVDLALSYLFQPPTFGAQLGFHYSLMDKELYMNMVGKVTLEVYATKEFSLTSFGKDYVIQYKEVWS